MNLETIGDVLVIELPERLDAAVIAAIEQDLSAAVVAHRGKALADMSGVAFVASLALRMLINNLRTVEPLGGDLRICGLQPQIAEIFRKSRFDTLFKIYLDRATALDEYAK